MPTRTCSNGRPEVNGLGAASRRRAKAAVALAFAATCAVGLSGGSARAGFLEDLFGAFSGERAAPSREYVYPERRLVRRNASSLSYAPRQHRAARRDGEKATAGPDAKNGLCYAEPAREPDPTRTETILHDATLREGDSVMTSKGLVVFQGGRACPHKESDFLALAEARDIPKSQRGALVAIEKAVSTPIASARSGSFASGAKLTSE